MAESFNKRQLQPEVPSAIAPPVRSGDSPLLPDADAFSFLKMKLDAIPKVESEAAEAAAAEKANYSAMMMKRQLKIEEDQLREASELYQETFNSLAKMGRGTTLKAAQKLLLQWYDPLIAALKADLEAITRGEFKDQNNVRHLLFVDGIAVSALTCYFFAVLRSLLTASTGGEAGGDYTHHHAEHDAAHRKHG